jgi:beta-lactamase regulating signal transducer with metallopeptidase domain
MIDLLALANIIVAFVATYLLHSTLLLSMCWVFFKVVRSNSHFLAERAWKLAAVIGLLTAALQVSVGTGSRIEWNWLASRASHEQLAAIETTVAPLDRSADTTPLAKQPSDHGSVSPESVEFAGPIVTLPNSQVTPIDEPALEITPPTVGPQLHTMQYESERLSDDVGTTTNLPFNPESLNKRHALLPWLTATAALLLVCFVVVGGVMIAVQSFRLRSRFSRARELQGGTARLALDRFLKRNKVRGKIRLLSSTKQKEPVAYGIFVWTIILPEQIEQRLNKEELKALLAHEVAHLVRGDVWWLWIGRVLCSCLAFQPLNLLARRRWQQASEYLCDDWAVERGASSLSLARCLTKIAEWRFGNQTREVGLAAGGTKITLVQRVERLVASERRADLWKQPLRRRMLTFVAALTVISLAGFAPRIDGSSGSRKTSGPELLRVQLQDSSNDWHALEEELLQLEVDLERVNQLLKNDSRVIDVLQNFNRQAAKLQARRNRINSLFEKELKQ